MPYVPAGLPDSSYRDNKIRVVHWRQPLGKLSPTVYTENSSLRFRVATKVGSSGKKVHYSFGWWSPVRNYQRSAVSVRLVGSYEHWAAKDGYSWQYHSWVLPWNRPANPSSFQFTKTGVLTSGVPVLSTNTRARLITECILKIGDRKVDIAESLAESGKAVDHLAKTTISVVKALLALRRRNWRAFAKALGLANRSVLTGKSASRRWLEAQYAWLPLLSDIYNFSELAKNGLPDKPPVISATRNLRDSYPWEGGNTGYADMIGTMVINHRCKLWYRLDDATLLRLSQVGVINPLEVAWALLPYSFVVDWFLPVGNFLEAWSGTMGLTFVDGAITGNAVGEARGDHKAAQYPAAVKQSGDFVWVVSQKGIKRDKLTSVSPSLYFKSPFSSTHVVSALALLRQLRK